MPNADEHGDENALTGSRPGDSSSAETRTATSPPPSPRRDSTPVPWGDYTLLEQIGQGGFGTVHRAWDPVLHRDIALKVIDLSRLPEGAEASVLREGQLMARVRHRNVVTIYRAQRIGNEVGLAMELIRGRTLGEILQQHGPLKVRDAVRIGCELCDALDAVHREGLVHRDVKASNVMRDTDGRVVLMDFGAGRERNASLEALTGVVGTPLYMAPEVLEGAAATAAADIYSLGVLLFHLLSGRYPLEGEGFEELMRAHRRGGRATLNTVRPDVPAAVARVVEETLAPLVDDRPRSAVILKRDLQGAEASSRKTPSKQKSGHVGSGRRRSRFDAGSALQTLALTMSVGVVLCAACGFLTTTAFNMALARNAPFASETPWQYVVWGARSLVAPMALVTLLVVGVSVVDLLLAVIRGLFPRVQRLVTTVTERASDVASRAGGMEPARVAQIFCLVGLAALAAVITRFSPLIAAIMGSDVNEGAVSALALLGSAGSGQHLSFRLWLHVITLALVAGLIVVLRLARRRGERVGLVALSSVAAPLLVALFLASTAWRILFVSTFPIVDYRGSRCFALGSTDDEVLINCPSLPPPRNQTKSRGDPELRRTGTEGALFDAFEPQAR